MIFKVNFLSGSVWCSNIAIADNEQDVINYYSNESDSVYISEGNAYDVEEAERKGKPIKKF